MGGGGGGAYAERSSVSSARKEVLKNSSGNERKELCERSSVVSVKEQGGNDWKGNPGGTWNDSVAPN